MSEIGSVLLNQEYGKESFLFVPTDYKSVPNGIGGADGDVYYFYDGCIKILHKCYSIEYEHVIKDIRSINHPNLYKIRDLYYSDSNGKRKLSAYTMNYYKKIPLTSIFKFPMEYIIDNFAGIYELGKLFAMENIQIRDLHCGNIIVQEDKIVIIDGDNYRKKDNVSKESLYEMNTRKINTLLHDIFSSAAFDLDDSKLVESIDFQMNSLVSDPPQKIFKVLSKYKYPLEFFK